ncbi:MAG: pilus assembly protein PapD, partial [Verrucomicrobia bacterium]|nr:pilus assembly protein PapD [Verrucomicrobiota bacterium]
RATLKDKNGEPLSDQRWEGWYLLAGHTRDYSMKVAPELCAKIAAVTVEAAVDGEVVKATQPVSVAACGP